MSLPGRPDVYRIESPEQIALLQSPVRQDILDTVEANGPSTVSELARGLGRPADGLYYHVGLLVEGGLLREAGVRETSRRDATLYALPGRRLRLRYPEDDAAAREAVARMAASMARVAERDFRAALTSGAARVEGDDRDLWAGRSKAWLSPSDLERVNALLDRLARVFEDARRGPESRLVSLTWLLSPVEARPPRRG